MARRNYFKLAIIISVAVHFSLLLVSPVWTTPAEEEEPEIIEVELITVAPEEPKPEPEAAPAPPPPPPPPEEPEKKPPRLEPVEMPVNPTKNIPVLTPTAQPRPEKTIPMPQVPAKAAVPTREERPPERVAREVAKETHITAEGPTVPSRMTSPIAGERPTFVPSPSGEEGQATGTATGGPITFEELGSRTVTYSPDVLYPPEMEEIGAEGKGRARIKITANGHVIAVSIVEPSGWPAFDSEIQTKLYRYRFSEVPSDLGPQEAYANFNFRLQH